MKAFTRIGILAGLLALAFLINPDVTRAQNSRNCAWPIELSPEASGNDLAPEYVARYWVMPFEPQYDTMTIKGTYPSARYFSFVAYNVVPNNDNKPPNVDVAGHLYDATIAPIRAASTHSSRRAAATAHIPSKSRAPARVLGIRLRYFQTWPG